MEDDVEKRLTRIETNLNGLASLIAVVSIIGLGSLLFELFKVQWGWNWVVAIVAAWAIAIAIAVSAYFVGFAVSDR